MEVRKTIKPPVDNMIVRHEEVVLVVNGTKFLFTEEMIDQHLSEGWMENESSICEVNGLLLELYPQHYRDMKRALHPFGR